MKETWRELSTDELAMMEALRARGRVRDRLDYLDDARRIGPDWRVKFFHQGNFTVAILRDARSDRMRVGVSKRNCALDPYRRIAGERQALRRAFLNPSIGAEIDGEEVLSLKLKAGAVS